MIKEALKFVPLYGTGLRLYKNQGVRHLNGNGPQRILMKIVISTTGRVILKLGMLLEKKLLKPISSSEILVGIIR